MELTFQLAIDVGIDAGMGQAGGELSTAAIARPAGGAEPTPTVVGYKSTASHLGRCCGGLVIGLEGGQQGAVGADPAIGESGQCGHGRAQLGEHLTD